MTADALRGAFRTLLEAAASVSDGDAVPEPPAGEWNADQILAHVSLVTAATLATVATIAAGANAAYDNRLAQDAWTIEHTIELAGGHAGLRERIGAQADALCALVGAGLGDRELDTPVPSRLVSNRAVMVDQPLALRDIIAGLAAQELPGHAEQLLALKGRARVAH
ncbi:DinB family protein [Actinacidiphila yeochonensis]|uniref:DinB family protein n=1 Tax=Actinacidiphila yeochonensis TaxID=89050 RepID=UPI00099DECBE|nr:DinB family protein [Actinacidiphila yeochonensis]